MKKDLIRNTLAILIAVAMGSGMSFASEWAEAEATAHVDWNRSEGQINRALFSTQGFMQVYVEPNPYVMDTFTLLNPQGTQTRLETYIHQMEPQNDNDDPDTIDWDRMNPDGMIRFIDDREKFLETVDELGMEPLSLLCYNVKWLESGDPDDPLASKEEWAEFAAAVVETYNGKGEDYTPRMTLAQVWNEPNMPHFYGGTMESYFELFNLTADRLHANYPGVQVIGPNISHAWHTEPKQWMERFIEECGSRADIVCFHHYGPQGEGSDLIMNDVRERAEKFRAIPGKENGKIMITETDAWFQGWPKMQFIFERQFGFLELSHLIDSVHHFCCMAYNESGNYTFGMVDKRGGVIGGVYWPYWLFRNLIGAEAYLLKGGSRAGDFMLVASHHGQDEAWISTAVFHNTSEKNLTVQTRFDFPASDKDRVLAVERVTRGYQGLESVQRVPAGSSATVMPLRFEAGEAKAVRLQSPGKRHFGFRDLNNQEKPWMSLTASAERIGLGETLTLEGKLVNTTFEEIRGEPHIAGLPEGWTIEPLEQPAGEKRAAFGEEVTYRFAVTAATLPKVSHVGLVAYWRDKDGDPLAEPEAFAHAIPVSLEVKQPLRLVAVPKPIHALPGETNSIALQLENLHDEMIEAKVRAVIERFDYKAEPRTVTLDPGERRRLLFDFAIPEDEGIGFHRGDFFVEFLGTQSNESFQVDMGEGTPASNATPLDLTDWINIDAAAFFSNRTDFDRDSIGMFTYPADYTPSGRKVSIRGVPYKMASLDDGKQNAILPKGQKISVSEGSYQGVAFMGFGHDGKHPGTWTFHYADGTSDSVESQIPEWCTPPPEGFQVAFRAPHRYIEGGPAEPPCELFTWTLETDPEKKLTAIELPSFDRAAYLFAITLLGTE